MDRRSTRIPRQGPHLGVRKRRPGGHIRRDQKRHPKIADTNGGAASKTDPFWESRKTRQKCEQTPQMKKHWRNPYEVGGFLEARKWTDVQHESPRQGPHLGVRKRRPGPVRSGRGQKRHSKIADTNRGGVSKTDPFCESRKTR